MPKQNFDKFINKEVKGAKKKEQIKQEKKLVKKEREAFFIEKKREQRATKKLHEEQDRKSAYNRRKGLDNPKETNQSKKTISLKRDKPASKPKERAKPFSKNRSEEQTRKPALEKRSVTRPARGEKKPSFKKSFDAEPSQRQDKPFRATKKLDTGNDSKREKPSLKKNTDTEVSRDDKFQRPAKKFDAGDNYKTEKPNFKKSADADSFRGEKPVRATQKPDITDSDKKAFDGELTRGGDKPLRTRKKIERSDIGKKEKPSFKPTKTSTGSNSLEKPTASIQKTSSEKTATKGIERPAKPVAPKKDESVMPLNKYIAHSGVCSRRDAGELVKQGKVTVNGEVVTDPGTKVTEDDKVTVGGKKLTLQHTLVYILLNKPKDYITTAEDPQGRKTVLDIVQGATPERIFPVGRLDRNTSGVLLLTNDGDLAQQLTHPSYEVRKIYEAKLDKPLVKADFTKLVDGVTLEDGFVRADSVAYADSKDKSIIGIEIHSGRNRVVRRMFEHLGYDVRGLDRVMFANLTKKNVDRGKWRFLTEKEVRLLKYFKSAM